METNKTIKFADFPTDEQPVVTRLQVTYSQQSDTISPTGDDNSITLTYKAGYCTISTNRWAIDNPVELTEILRHFYSIINEEQQDELIELIPKRNRSISNNENTSSLERDTTKSIND